MGSRLAPLAAAVVWSALGSSCPQREEARVVTLAPSPAVAAPAPPPAARPRPAAEPASKPSLATPEAADLADERVVDPELDETAEPAPSEAMPPPAPIAPKHALASIGKETWIYASPRWGSRRLGYLRAGAVVARSAAPAGYASCDKGWYHVEPRGYVCVGAYATKDLAHPVVRAADRRPERGGLPYLYALSGPTPPILYARVPSKEEAERAEPGLAQHLRVEARRIASDPALALPEPIEAPAWALAGKGAPVLGNASRSAGALEIGRPTPRSGFALLSTFEAGDRRWGLTTELALVPLDRTRLVKPSAFAGVVLDQGGPPSEGRLVVAFARGHHANRWTANEGGGFVSGAALGFREGVALTGEKRRVGGVTYLEARDGTFVREEEMRVVSSASDIPGWARGARKWIDVSIVNQTLVAYEGRRPVFVTLVSTGADGLGDPKKTHSTIQGLFRIHTKHVSVTMDDDAEGNAFDFRDVPFVQYFTEGFALHAAYWHDDFGTARSHGCVNLSPKDAAWLFGWTGPDVPEAWHGALSKLGTLVRTRP